MLLDVHLGNRRTDVVANILAETLAKSNEATSRVHEKSERDTKRRRCNPPGAPEFPLGATVKIDNASKYFLDAKKGHSDQTLLEINMLDANKICKNGQITSEVIEKILVGAENQVKRVSPKKVAAQKRILGEATKTKTQASTLSDEAKLGNRQTLVLFLTNKSKKNKKKNVILDVPVDQNQSKGVKRPLDTSIATSQPDGTHTKSRGEVGSEEEEEPSMSEESNSPQSHDKMEEDGDDSPIHRPPSSHVFAVPTNHDVGEISAVQKVFPRKFKGTPKPSSRLASYFYRSFDHPPAPETACCFGGPVYYDDPINIDSEVPRLVMEYNFGIEWL